MWTRKELKQNAWNSLKPHYWAALGVSLLAGLLGGTHASGKLDFSEIPSAYENLVTMYMQEGGVESEAYAAALVTLGIILLIAVPIGLVLYAFLSGPVNVGYCKFFMQAREDDVQISHLFSAFTGGRYMNIVKVMFLRCLYTSLWSLLFVIPGIIKGYEYYLIPYLLAENPNLPKDRAFAISKQAMNGEKWNVFVLELSFIGWYLLGLLACCLGMFAVVPYEKATYTEFYACMRAKIVAQGIAAEEELTGGVISAAQNPYDM